MMEDWFARIEPSVFTIFKTRMKEDFPNAKYTTSNQDVREKDFPCVYIREAEQQEWGNDLDNTSINAVRSVFRVQVYSKTAAENRAIMTKAVLQMKQLRFNVESMPVYASERDKSVFLSNARFVRIIAGGDRDIVPQD